MMKPPKYVRLDNSELRYIKSNTSDEMGYYWRDADEWKVDVRYDSVLNKWFSICKYNTPWLHDVELIPITKEEWKIGNEGFI